jgi:hypothetical protein
LDLDTDRVEDCVDRQFNTTNLTGSLCSENNSSYLKTIMDQLDIVYGDEESTREACGIIHTTHFPEVRTIAQ